MLTASFLAHSQQLKAASPIHNTAANILAIQSLPYEFLSQTDYNLYFNTSCL